MLNRVMLIGRLGNDPELRLVGDAGIPKCTFSLATDRTYKNREGKFETITEWHSIVAWRELGQRLHEKLQKGRLVYVEGEIGYREYTDRNDQKQRIAEITVQTVRALTPPKSVVADREESTAPVIDDIMGDDALPF